MIYQTLVAFSFLLGVFAACGGMAAAANLAAHNKYALGAMVFLASLMLFSFMIVFLGNM